MRQYEFSARHAGAAPGVCVVIVSVLYFCFLLLFDGDVFAAALVVVTPRCFPTSVVVVVVSFAFTVLYCWTIMFSLLYVVRFIPKTILVLRSDLQLCHGRGTNRRKPYL